MKEKLRVIGNACLDGLGKLYKAMINHPLVTGYVFFALSCISHLLFFKLLFYFFFGYWYSVWDNKVDLSKQLVSYKAVYIKIKSYFK